MRVAGDKLIAYAFTQAFKGADMVFAVKMAVETVLHAVVVQQISKGCVLKIGRAHV